MYKQQRIGLLYFLETHLDSPVLFCDFQTLEYCYIVKYKYLHNFYEDFSVSKRRNTATHV